MPRLEPVPIRTKNAMFSVRLWIWMTSIRKWTLLENWSYTLPDSGRVVVVPAGFEFDGASIPRPLWFILSPVGLLLIPGLIHDFAYRYTYLWVTTPGGGYEKFGEDFGRLDWDRQFRDVSLAVNGMAGVDIAAWIALVLFGWFAWNNNRKANPRELHP